MIRWILTIVLATPFLYRGAQWLIPHNKPVNAAQAQSGKDLFLHEWTPRDPLAAGGDGLGPVFNARSCVACHIQGGTGGSGGAEHNVTMFTTRETHTKGSAGLKDGQGVVHSQAISREFQETLAHVAPGLPGNVPAFPNQSAIPLREMGSLNPPNGVSLSQRKTPALFGAKFIDEIPDRDIIANERIQRLKWGLTMSQSKTLPVGRVLRFADGRIGRFGWKAQTVSLGEFVRAACANELGLGNPGQAQPWPLGNPGYRATGPDLTAAQCDQLTEFVCSLSRPVERLPENAEARRLAASGKSLFNSVGCADCHMPDVGNVRGLYSDLLLHDMGQELEAGGNYTDRPLDDPAFKPGTGPAPAEWRTPPLWGVARSAPYLHDGRAATLHEAITQHRGQGQRSAQRYAALSASEQEQLFAFLKTLETP